MPKGRQQLSPLEEAVRARLEAIVGVPVEQVDHGTGRSIHDLAIVYLDREPAPVEVTTAVDQAELEASASNGMDPWPTTRLRHSWNLASEGRPPNFRSLRREAEPLLEVLEAYGLGQFSPGTTMVHQVRTAADGDGLELWRALHRLAELRVQQGNAWTRTEGPQTICPVLARGGTWGGTAHAVSAWVEDFVTDPTREDNIRKLDRGGAESHLAVHVTLSGAGFAVWRGLLDQDRLGLLPDADPTIPATITDLWLSTSFADGDVLHWSRATSWTRHPRRIHQEGVE